MLRHTTLCACVVVIMAMSSTHAQRRSGACAELSGNAWGLCNAYCNAMDCDTNPKASQRACDQVAANFLNATKDVISCATSTPPDTSSPPTESQPGSCPCDFDVESWVPNQNQILKTSNLPLCTGSLTNCITCDIKTSVFGSFTSLSVLVNLFNGTVPEPKDSLLFFITEPFDPPAGEACGVDVSFNSPEETPITTEDPVSIAQFPACISDLGALQSAYLALCNQSPPR